MGKAIQDYHQTGRAKTLRILSPMFEDDELPVAHLFRTKQEMNMLERTALELAHGRVLEVGAGSGCHTLYLQERGLETTAIDVSPIAVEVQRQRGVKDARLIDFFDMLPDTRFDTILMLMNGIGICGKCTQLPYFFARIDTLLAPGGCLITDSSDLAYIYEDEEGILDLTGVTNYYGEIEFQMQYSTMLGPTFHWLYVDLTTLTTYANAAGFTVTLVQEDENNSFLVKIERM